MRCMRRKWGIKSLKPKECFQLAERQRFTYEISLHDVAAGISQKCKLLFIFNAFRYNDHSELLRKVNNCFNYMVVTPVFNLVIYKAAVILSEFIGRFLNCASDKYPVPKSSRDIEIPIPLRRASTSRLSS